MTFHYHNHYITGQYIPLPSFLLIIAILTKTHPKKDLGKNKYTKSPMFLVPLTINQGEPTDHCLGPSLLRPNRRRVVQYALVTLTETLFCAGCPVDTAPRLTVIPSDLTRVLLGSPQKVVAQ